jgi:hypothetical protein
MKEIFLIFWNILLYMSIVQYTYNVLCMSIVQFFTFRKNLLF